MALERRSSRHEFDVWKARDGVRSAGDGGDSEARVPRGRSFVALLRVYWSYLGGHRVTLGASLATLSVSTGLALIPPYATKLIFDYSLAEQPVQGWLTRVTGGDRVGTLYVVCAAVIVTTVIGIGFSIWGRWQCTRLVKRVQVRMRRRVFEHAANLPLGRVQEMKSGGVSSILREDAGGVGDLIFSLIYNPWRALTQLLGTLAILALIDWRMLVASLVLLPLVWLSHRTWIGRIRPMYRAIRRTRQGVDAQAAEVFSGMRVVRGFGRVRAENTRFSRRGHLMARQELRAWWWSRALEILWQLLVPVATVGVLVYFGRGVIEGDRTTGDLIAFLLYLGWLLGPLESLVSSAANVQNQLAGLDRVIDLMEEPREFAGQEASLTVDSASVRGRLALEGVGFAYPVSRRARRSAGRFRLGDTATDGRQEATDDTAHDGTDQEPVFVLQDITLDVEPGETIALVGPSGSGKTTLCNLVARFFDPTRGRITLDGTDLRDIDPAGYRRLLGIVEQDVFLFDGSVAENIAYASRHATFEQITAAARTANAHRFITELPDGYDTRVGERGVRLSGGQKQRLAIARAVLADPRVLILDEATSSLDSESERLIQRSLAKLMEGRTCFVIAHRLSTIRHADRIVVLERGRIREIGAHDELMARDGRYAELVRLQTEDSETDEVESGLFGE